MVVWGSDVYWVSVEVCRIECEELDVELWLEGLVCYDMVVKVWVFEDGSVEFSGYCCMVV